MHRERVAVVQPTVGHRHRHTAAVVAEGLHRQKIRPAITRDDLGGNFIVQLHLRRGLDPQHRVRRGERIELRLRDLATQHASAAQLCFLLELGEATLRLLRVRLAGLCGKQHGDFQLVALGGLRRLLQSRVNFLLRAILPDELNKPQRTNLRHADVLELRHERIVRHVMQQRDTELGELRAPLRLRRFAELDDEQSGSFSGLTQRGNA